MREILFRGKRIDNGERVEGYYFCMVHPDDRHSHHFIIPLGCDLSKGTPIEKIQVEVIPETVGQYTKFDDKNGKKIFEGDILDCLTCDYDGSDKWVCGCRITDITDFQLMGSLDCCHEIEVVGNIFDNPELMKGGEQ